MLQKKIHFPGKWMWWAIPLWLGIAFLSYSFTTNGFASINADAVFSPRFATSGDWPMYLAGPGRSGYNSAETVINKTSAPNLKLHWQYHSGGNISTQPVVVKGVIYWGSWDGYEHATDLNGKQ